jgi:hypothetical protein
MRILVVAAASVLVAGCAGATSTAGSTAVANSAAATTPVSTSATTSSARATPVTPKPTSTEVVPGLSPLAAEHIELKSAKKRKIAGLTAYYLTLSKGHMWAIKGAPAGVVPKVMALESYNPNASTFFHSKPYVIYMPNLLDAPDAFNNFVGPRPGMTVIDTDVPLEGQ